MVNEVRPDLILLDVHLPDVHGVEVCRRVKQDAESASIIVLQISASAISAPHAIAALNTGADSYLVEPIDPDVLVATVRAFLRLRRAERGLAHANQALDERNSELKNANEALRRSNDDLEHFAYIASHDLQEPLRTIRTHLQLLDRVSKNRLDESERQLFDFVVEASLRMSTLINDLLSYSRIGMEPVQLEPTNLGEALAWAIDNLSQGIAESGAVVTAGDMPEVWGDRLQLSQVFQNLIGNSLKYRSQLAPVVDICAARDAGGDWLVRVRDNGLGIPEEYAEQVFRPFKRLHGRDVPGNGIGLAVTRRIIECHGGNIRVEPSEGGGATFLFTLKPAAHARGSSS